MFLKRIVQAVLVILVLPYVLALLYVIAPPPSTQMLGRMLSFQPVARQWVPLKDISPSLIAAVVSSEDDAFCAHHGFDFTQLEKSIKKAQEYDAPVKATSTISPQTAKNLFLWNGHSWLRKILEAPLTAWLELTWNKRRILEVYLNIAQWGDGIYGAEAASRSHFGVPARALSPDQAALLAASLPDPIHRHPGHPGTGTLLIASALERRMAMSAPQLACLQ